MSIFPSPGKKLSHARRYNEILGVLVKYGFEDFVAHLEETDKVPWLRKMIPRKKLAHAVSLTKWEKMRLVCEELGPTFVKFGQILSNRPDLLPAPLIKELEKLQDAVPPFSSDEALAMVENELEKPASEIFDDFNPVPFASASIAQVHRAVLKEERDEIVIKIQRPGIKQIILSDIDIMLEIADIFSRNVPSIRNFDPVGLVKNFEKSIGEELDFVHESINVQRFREITKDDEHVYAPQVYRKYTTEKVLTLEFIEGIKVSKTVELEEAGLDRELIAKRAVNSLFKQIFHHGFFHADPHAGNVLVMPDNMVCFLDFGMMGTILRKDVEQITAILMAIDNKDTKQVMYGIQRMSDDVYIKEPKKFEYDLDEFVNYYAVRREFTTNEMSFMLLSLKDIIIKHNLTVPVHFFLLSRALVALEGLTRHLAPDLNLVNELRPYMVELVKRRFNPFAMGRKMLNVSYEFGAYLEDLPMDLRQTIKKIKSGEIKVDLEHKGIDPLIHTVNRVSRQIVAAIIVSALLIVSGLVIVADIPPHWGETSALGVIGLILAGVIGIGLFFNLIKKDKGY